MAFLTSSSLMAQNYGRAQGARIPISNNITMRRECAQRRLFVFSHKPAVAVHIGAESGGELGLQNPPLIDGNHSATR
jgi:hypothetical protein